MNLQILQENGFFYFDICTSIEIEKLKTLYFTTQLSTETSGIFVSHNSGDSNTAIKNSEEIYHILASDIKRLFPDHNYFLGHFAIKNKHTFHNFDLHRDWNIVDESVHNSIQVWIPLSISTPENGGMCFISGSHLFNNAPRSGSLGKPVIKIEPEIFPYLSFTHLMPGQAVGFFNSVFHGSFSNPSEETRLAVLINLVPKNAVTEYFHWNENTDTLQTYSMSANELLMSLPELEKGKKPVTALKKEYVPHAQFKKQDIIAKEDLFAWVNEREQLTDYPQGNITLKISVWTALNEKGYVVIKNTSFGWQELKNNPILYDKLKNAQASESFYYSLLNNSKEANLIISSLVAKQFKLALYSIFPSSRFLSGSFLVKPAQEYSELYLHQDWSYTDEKHFTPITAWSPLTDTDETSGGMFFLKGSHKYFDTIRSQSYETARYPLAEIGRENIEAVQVQQGDILLFNPAVWHGSFRNTLPYSREVFTCIILPQEAPFYYYQKHSPEKAVRYELPDHALEYYLCSMVNGSASTMFSGGKTILYNDTPQNSSELLKKHRYGIQE